MSRVVMVGTCSYKLLLVQYIQVLVVHLLIAATVCIILDNIESSESISHTMAIHVSHEEKRDSPTLRALKDR
jgi:hypothetical protein